MINDGSVKQLKEEFKNSLVEHRSAR